MHLEYERASEPRHCHLLTDYSQVEILKLTIIVTVKPKRQAEEGGEKPRNQIDNLGVRY